MKYSSRYCCYLQFIALLCFLFSLFLCSTPNAYSQATCNFEQITVTDSESNTNPTINADGTRIAFVSAANITGDNPDRSIELFLWDKSDGITQITDTDFKFNIDPSINKDGTKIAFVSDADLTGMNPDLNSEIYVWDELTEKFTQITDTTESGSSRPSINGDGSRVAFISDADFTGKNPEGNTEIYLWDKTAGFTRITDTSGSSSLRPFHVFDPVINEGGNRIAFNSDVMLTEEETFGIFEIFLWDSIEGLRQITINSGIDPLYPSISYDGNEISYEGSSNTKTGTEIFIWDSNSGSMRVTKNIFELDDSVSQSLSGDGNTIAFFTESHLYVWNRDAGLTEIINPVVGFVGTRSVNEGGTHITFVSKSDITGMNPEGNEEIFLAVCSFQSLPKSKSGCSQSGASDPESDFINWLILLIPLSAVRIYRRRNKRWIEKQ